MLRALQPNTNYYSFLPWVCLPLRKKQSVIAKNFHKLHSVTYLGKLNELVTFM